MSSKNNKKWINHLAHNVFDMASAMVRSKNSATLPAVPTEMVQKISDDFIMQPELVKNFESYIELFQYRKKQSPVFSKKKLLCNS